MTYETHWHGRPLSDYSKAELIGIVEELGRMLFAEQKRATRELNVLTGRTAEAMREPWKPQTPQPFWISAAGGEA